jgi:chromosome segregation ATPase
VPSRSEVSSLGERLQALRRELRANQVPSPENHSDEIATLRRELAALKHQFASSPTPAAPAAKKRATAKPDAVAVKKAIAKAPVVAPRKTVSSKAAPAGTNPRKRK